MTTSYSFVPGDPLELDLQMGSICDDYRYQLINNTSDFVGLTSVLQKHHSHNCLKHLALMGSSNTGRETISEIYEEIKDFFEACGELEMLESLSLQNLAMPLHLLTCLFRKVPNRFRSLSLDNVEFLDGKDDGSEIQDFISTIKEIPTIHVIQTTDFLLAGGGHPSRTNKDLASELVKLPLVNIFVSIDFTVGRPFIYDQWRRAAENRPRMGAYVIVNDIELATDALTSNTKLELLSLTQLDPIKKTKKMSSFLGALGHCKTLDTLYLRFDINRPQEDLLEGLASVLSELSIRKLYIENIAEASFKKVEKKFAVGLSENNIIQELEFLGEAGQVYSSEKFDFYLYLNRSHHGGLDSRKEIESNAGTILVDKWVDIFASLANQTDLICLSALYYYLHVYYGANQHPHKHTVKHQQHLEGTHEGLARSGCKETGSNNDLSTPSIAQDEEVALVGASHSSCCYIL